MPSGFEFRPEGFMNAEFLAGLLVNAVCYCGHPLFLISFIAIGVREWDMPDNRYAG